MTFRMTAVPISRQVVDGDAVLADSQCTCIFQSSCEWYFINFVGKFGIHSGMLFELPLKKKHKAVKTHHHEGFFYFYQNITPMHLVLQSMYVVLVLAKKMVKDCCTPPPWIHPERVWDLAIINKLLKIMGTYFLPNFGEIHYVISER